MDGCPEPLERIFRKVEAESERRAQEDSSSRRADTSRSAQKGSSSTTFPARNRRRGSISITRFGQLADNVTRESRPATPKHASTIASQAAFYQARMSADTFASGGSAHLDDDAYTEEDNQITQMHKIAGRHSISKTMEAMLPRRLSRARSSNVLVTGDASMVIGVSVEEATVESAEGIETSRASVHAPGGLRSQPSRLTMAGSFPARNSWVAKAKGFTQRFRRKDKPSRS